MYILHCITLINYRSLPKKMVMNFLGSSVGLCYKSFVFFPHSKKNLKSKVYNLGVPWVVSWVLVCNMCFECSEIFQSSGVPFSGSSF